MEEVVNCLGRESAESRGGVLAAHIALEMTPICRDASCV